MSEKKFKKKLKISNNFSSMNLVYDQKAICTMISILFLIKMIVIFI